MIQFEHKNQFLSQAFASLYYVSLATLIVLSGLELAKRGFVSYHFNLVWLVLLVLISGTLYAIFKASPMKSGIFSMVVFLFVVFALFFVVGAQIGVDFINNYLLALFIVINLGLTWYLLRPEIKKE
ncbi:hypothetical protein GWN26_05120 [Candidatus Saccharibacteria bacterium]|nr:hypothetical protein [Candidatus Saccharibacteria bacterium]NIW78799.1 hypothetical protein [Calditrichia bacterium]